MLSPYLNMQLASASLRKYIEPKIPCAVQEIGESPQSGQDIIMIGKSGMPMRRKYFNGKMAATLAILKDRGIEFDASNRFENNTSDVARWPLLFIFGLSSSRNPYAACIQTLAGVY